MAGFEELMSDPRVRDSVMQGLGYVRDGAQGASNAAAQSVTMPVDTIAWLLRLAGVDVGATPFGGSEWMKRVGLTREPGSEVAGSFGESLSMAAPNLAAARTAAPMARLIDAAMAGKATGIAAAQR